MAGPAADGYVARSWGHSIRRLGRAATRWRHWRRTRPFWGGLLTVAGGVAIMALPAGGYSILRLPGLIELSPLIFGGLIIAVGINLWANPRHCAVTGLVAVAFALAAFLFAALGGYMVGSVLAILGGSFGHAWTADPVPLELPNAVHDVSENEPGS
ncbi:DUF6114 domain-containing protein [Nocardia goodfellowii]